MRRADDEVMRGVEPVYFGLEDDETALPHDEIERERLILLAKRHDRCRRERIEARLRVIAHAARLDLPATGLEKDDELTSLEDTLELLSDPAAMQELEEARRAATEGDYITGDELRARFAAK